MVDAIDLVLGEVAMESVIQRASRLEVIAEWLLHDDPGPSGALSEARSSQPFDGVGEDRWRKRQVDHAIAARLVFGIDGVDARRKIVELSRAVDALVRDVALCPDCCLIRRDTGCGERLCRRGAVGVVADVGRRHPEHVARPTAHDCVEGREQLSHREVAGAAEYDEEMWLGDHAL